MLKPTLALAMILPLQAFAIGSDTDEAPTPTETTEVCTDGKVWDIKIDDCVNPEDLSAEGKEALENGDQSSLNNEILFDAVREFAYAGQYLNAQRALRAISDKNDDMVLTYWGFTHRKLGNQDLAERYYWTALKLNPENVLTRSYLGQGYVDAGNLRAAKKQLEAIEDLGGKETWAFASLQTAIESGVTVNY